MKSLIFLAAFVFANAFTEDIDPLLTSNAFALVGEFPSAAFLRAPGTPRQPTCGATIIDRSHVLTSAQCVTNNQNQIINPFWYIVLAGRF
jgi:secreted trypsin-like serine protease